jgi:hypothetical protein
MEDQFKITFCIVARDRLHQLKETLQKNITDNADYSDLEFVLLDYNSTDGTGDWIARHMAVYLDCGRLRYYHTSGPLSWHPSHSRNVAFRLAHGDVICNINADHYTGTGFAKYVNEAFQNDNRIVLTTIDMYKTDKGHRPAKDVLGKVCVRREDFLAVRGFDERMDRYGFEDYDLINRLEMIHLKRVIIKEKKYLRFVRHDDNERFSVDADRVSAVYLNYRTPASTDMILLYTNQQYQAGQLIDNEATDAEDPKYAYQARDHLFSFSLAENKWRSGTWALKDKNLLLCDSDNQLVSVFAPEDENGSEDLTDLKNENSYQKVKDPGLIRTALLFEHYMTTRIIMEENLASGIPTVNPDGFGQADVFSGFQLNNSKISLV